MDSGPIDVTAYRELRERLRETRSELQKVPRWYSRQFVLLAISIPAIGAIMKGLIPVFVPPYLLLPFVLFPSWKLFHGERTRRAELRAVTAQLCIVEARLPDK